MTHTPDTGLELLSAEDRISRVLSLREAGDDQSLAELIAGWHGGEVAEVLEGLPSPDRNLLWSLLPEAIHSDVLSYLHDRVRAGLLESIPTEDAVAATLEMEPPDLAEVIASVSDELGEAIMESLGSDERSQVEESLAYPEASAGRLMETEWVAVRGDVSLEVVSRYVRRRGSLPPHTDGLMVVDREGHYEGKLAVDALLTRNPEQLVMDVMQAEADCVAVDTEQSQVAALFQRRDLVSVAVVDRERRLVGRIVVDDVMGIIRAEAEQPLMQMAGLEQGEDLFAPVLISARRRLLWLGTNLLTAFLASWVIGRFQATLDQIVALAVLMPIVASMGGIAGSQTLTLAIRGLALGQITDANTRWLAWKEIAIAAINGLVWALVVGVVAWSWFGIPGIALVLGLAMIVNLFAAAASGLAIPLVLERVGLDPALSGSVILTTVTDVVGFVSFLGLATWLLL
jgi:magnesium transporter